MCEQVGVRTPLLLYNAVVEILRHHGLQQRSDEVESVGVNFVNHSLRYYGILTVTMTPFLVVDTRLMPASPIFKVLKHRKHAACNMSAH